MGKSLGRNQIAECQRSGKKMLARELVRDGRNPMLLVAPEWADPAHPQERPFIPDGAESKARFPIAPENLKFTAPVVAAVQVGGLVRITWTQADFGPSSLPDIYTLYRSVNGGAFSVLNEITVEYTRFGALVSTLLFDDGAVVGGNTYSYKMVATNDLFDSPESNVVTLTLPA